MALTSLTGNCNLSKTETNLNPIQQNNLYCFFLTINWFIIRSWFVNIKDILRNLVLFISLTRILVIWWVFSLFFISSKLEEKVQSYGDDGRINQAEHQKSDDQAGHIVFHRSWNQRKFRLFNFEPSLIFRLYSYRFPSKAMPNSADQSRPWQWVTRFKELVCKQ